MDSSKVSLGEVIAGASGVALFLFMLLPWYGVKDSVAIPGVGSYGGGTVSAWGAFTFIDFLLLIVAVIAVGLMVARAIGAMPKGMGSPGTLVAAAGALGLLLILFRLLATPDIDLSGVGFDAELGRKYGIFLSLLAAGGIAFGGYTAMTEQAGSSRR